MITVQQLIQEVAAARNLFLDTIANVSEEKAVWKPSPDTWCITEITEHLFWAEQGGIAGMWKTLHAIRKGAMEKNMESVHKNMPIERVIELTWKEKEQVPAVAAPRMGGSILFWRASFSGLQSILNEFGKDLQPDELRIQAHPHPISGAMDFQQRIEFLRFHINRHREQVAQLLAAMPQ